MTTTTFSLLFLSLLFPCTVSQAPSTPVPTITAEISPVNSEVQREGDTVSFLCSVENFDFTQYTISLNVRHTGGIDTVSNTDAPDTQRSYSYSFERTEPPSSSYVFNLTFGRIAQSDNGSIECNLIKIGPGNSYTDVERRTLFLRVYPPDAVPICRPEDKSFVVIGSQLECQTNGAATPTINGSRDGWVMRGNGQGQGALLIRSATLSDNGRTFVCSAITPDNRMLLSCNIGPLTVVEGLSTTQSVRTFSAGSEDATVTPVRTTISNAGLSAADISGIVVGAIVLIILIAIHALCCHCDPRKWMNAKSYLVNLGSSIGTWNQGTDSTRRQSEMGGSHPEELDSPPAYNAVLDEASGESHPDFVGYINRPISTPEPNIYSESSVAMPNLNLNIDLRLNMNIAPPDVASTSGVVDQAPAARKDPSVKIANEVSHATVSSTDGGRPTQNMPRETVSAAVKLSSGPQIYAEVNKPRGSAAENTNDDVHVPSGRSGKPVPRVKPKSVKKLGANKEQNESSDDAAPKGVIYADLNLHGGPDVEGGKIQTSEETPTIYAKIKH